MLDRDFGEYLVDVLESVLKWLPSNHFKTASYCPILFFSLQLRSMSLKVLNIIEYLILIVSEFAKRARISEAEAYAYLGTYGALEFCEKHYGVMHTLSIEDNIQSLIEYCRRKGGEL